MFVARAAFCLKIRKGMGPAYDEAHRHVWPEMLALLKRAGVSSYSIFRRDEQLFLFMEVDDFNATWDQLDADPVNQRWQVAMKEFFEPAELRQGERLPMMEEVFHCA
jgi:L-rhamnose mutarotase